MYSSIFVEKGSRFLVDVRVWNALGSVVGVLAHFASMCESCYLELFLVLPRMLMLTLLASSRMRHEHLRNAINEAEEESLR